MSDAPVRSSPRRTSRAPSPSEASASAPAPAARDLPGGLKAPTSLEERRRRAEAAAAKIAAEVPKPAAPAAAEPSAPKESAPAPAPAPAPAAPPAPAAARRTLSQLFKQPAAELTTLRDDAEKATQTIAPPADAVQLIKEVIDVQRCSLALQKKAAGQARREAGKENEMIVAELRREVEELKGELDLKQRRAHGMEIDHENAIARKDKARRTPTPTPNFPFAGDADHPLTTRLQRPSKPPLSHRNVRYKKTRFVPCHA